MYSYTGTYVCMYVSARMRTCVHACMQQVCMSHMHSVTVCTSHTFGDYMYVTHTFSDCAYVMHSYSHYGLHLGIIDAISRSNTLICLAAGYSEWALTPDSLSVFRPSW